jgi:DNA-binding CsgD family transcriptional regulator
MYTRLPSVQNSLAFVSLMFALFSLSVIFDLYIVYYSANHIQHYAKYLEMFIFLCGLVFFISYLHSLQLEKRTKLRHSVELEKLLARPNAEAVRNFESVLQTHFNVWKLSDAEKAVALHLLRGFTSKEISDIRQVSERTIRNQAGSIYAKAGLTGKHDLAAYFLEEFLNG